ncbi:DUF4247 domain-containing protein [Salibacterium qingdaonense]|uniref:DUF4247 domain-containing protein n=1 Tax=Salibacterium qingdaonense TaxID=266892 RepID=A0A1I4LR11_9BACI|nr:DUF4247 domain-containing protein [Salibacterium qingdaonense]SFL93444.1 protein of unknown function [Salibacterium qingdaonense]
MHKKVFIIMIALVFLLTGCLSGGGVVSQHYELENVMEDEAGNESHVYTAPDTTVPQAAATIQEDSSPEEVSAEDEERMFLVYDDRTIQVMEDSQNPGDTLVEVSEQEFVENNYSPSMLETYAMFRIMSDLYNMGARTRDKQYEGYVGTNGNYHRDPSTRGSNRSGSVNSTGTRGGGFGFGK